jgi:hypothetical protein
LKKALVLPLRQGLFHFCCQSFKPELPSLAVARASFQLPGNWCFRHLIEFPLRQAGLFPTKTAFTNIFLKAV